MAFGKAFAIVRIPRFGADYARPMLEGTSHDILQQGVGHYVGTAAAGRGRQLRRGRPPDDLRTPFHDIDTLVPGDLIVVETRASYSVYAVKRHVIVDAHRGRRPRPGAAASRGAADGWPG